MLSPGGEHGLPFPSCPSPKARAGRLAEEALGPRRQPQPCGVGGERRDDAWMPGWGAVTRGRVARDGPSDCARRATWNKWLAQPPALRRARRCVGRRYER